MTEFDLVNYITQQGFAIAVAVYLLYERTKITSEVLKIMERLTTVLDRLEEKLGKL